MAHIFGFFTGSSIGISCLGSHFANRIVETADQQMACLAPQPACHLHPIFGGSLKTGTPLVKENDGCGVAPNSSVIEKRVVILVGINVYSNRCSAASTTG